MPITIHLLVTIYWIDFQLLLKGGNSNVQHICVKEGGYN